ncbi:hypothetical protein BC831DRAFT_517148 [Entophlyctis helioformis]|nr:hypothetical protein BC831DRAFT_517148 [Entophlyctis helioformis]
MSSTQAVAVSAECTVLRALYPGTFTPVKSCCKFSEEVKCDDNGFVTTLNLDEQKIVGPIPEQLSTFSQLDTLILSRNQFTGPIPASLAKLTKLKTLSVASNFLTGTIPSELKDLKSLRSFRFDDNPALEGPFPTGFTATLASCNGTTTDVCLGPSHSGVSCSLAACE